MKQNKESSLKRKNSNITSIANKIKHTYLWIILAVLLLIYVTYSVKYFNSTVFQISSTLLTIYVIALAMYTSNNELHRASRIQTELLSHNLSELDNTIEDFKIFLETNINYIKTFLDTQKSEKINREQEISSSAVPIIYFITRWYKWGWFDVINQLLLKVENDGGYASNIVIFAGPINKRINIGSIGRGMASAEFNCGNPQEFAGPVVKMRIHLEDELQRKYFSEIDIDFSRGESVYIQLQSVT